MPPAHSRPGPARTAKGPAVALATIRGGFNRSPGTTPRRILPGSVVRPARSAVCGDRYAPPESRAARRSTSTIERSTCSYVTLSICQ